MFRAKVKPAVLLFAFIAVVLLTLSPIEAQEIEYVNSILWNHAGDVAVNGNYAYCAYSDGMLVYDISNPANPVIVSRVYLPIHFDTANERILYFFNDYIYINGAKYSTAFNFFIINVSDPLNPAVEGNCATQGNNEDIFVRDNYAYVADGESGLQIIDISDSFNPTIIGNLEIDGFCASIFASGNFAYLALGGSGLDIIDISNPSNPIFVGNYQPPDGFLVSDVFVIGSYAYLGVGAWGLYVVDISDPVNPLKVGDCNNNNDVPLSIFVSGNYAYTVDNTGLIACIDVSNPTAPYVVSSYEEEAFDEWVDYKSIFISNSYAYITAEHVDLTILDISDPSNLTEIWTAKTSGSIFSVHCKDSNAYVTDYFLGLQIVDISEPTNTALTGTYEYTKPLWEIDIFGDYLFTCHSGGGPNSFFETIDISIPSDPVLTGSIPVPEWIWGLCVRDSYAYTVNRDRNFYVIDISSAENPSVMGSCPMPSLSRSLCISGDYAYVAGGAAGLQIIHISDPSNPTIANNVPVECVAIYIIGDIAYLACDNAGLYTYDISDPLNLALLGVCDTPHGIGEIYVSGNYAYAITNVHPNSFLQVINIANPEQPWFVDKYISPVEFDDIFEYNGYIYIAAKTSLNIFRINLSTCAYVPGDINNDGNIIGSDVTYGVNYFRSIGSPPPVTCWNENDGYWLYSAADVNGDCRFIGSDITYLISYFRGINTEILWCAQTPPSGE